jgi:DNA-binding transcriptional LysR family regulator
MVVAIAEAGSLHRGAAFLGLTPAAVSKALLQLEARLGIRLFERGPQGVSSTSSGERLAEAARQILADLDRAVSGAQAAAQAVSGMVRLGLGPFALGGASEKLVLEVARDLPDLVLEIVPGYPEDLLAKLAAGQLDFLLCHLNQVRLPRLFTATRVQRLAPVILVGPDHPLARSEKVTGADLAPFRIAGSRPYGEALDWLREVTGMEAQPGLVSVDYQLNARALKLTNMYLIVSREVARRLVTEHGLVALPIALPAIAHHIFCVTRSGQPLQAAASRVLDLALALTGPDEA